MIVPDTIDPYVGYKALRIDQQGWLASPTYQVGWPVGKRFEATCPMQGYNWTLVEGTPPPHLHYGPHFGPHSRSTYQHGYDPRYYQTTGFISHGYGSALFPDPKPDFEPPKGFYWDWRVTSHTPADKDCTCGVYCVDHVDRTVGYLRHDCVVCEITMWGQVTIGDHGARGQYAYPTKMYVPDHLQAVAFTVAATYEIEAVPQPFKLGRHRGDFVSQPLRDPQADARVAAATFLACSGLTMSTSSIMNLLTDWRIGPIVFLIMAIGFFILFLLATYDSRKKTA